MLRIFVYILNRKKTLYKTRKSFRDLFQEDELDLSSNQPITYIPVSFAELGVQKDFVIAKNESSGDYDIQSVSETLERQQCAAFVGGDSIFSVSSVDVLNLKLDDRELFAIHKKLGKDAGQRVWFSIHELSYLCYTLADLIEAMVEDLKSA